MNYADAERVKSVLETLGYVEGQQEEKADLILVMSCSVRQKAMDRIYGKGKIWNQWKKERPLFTVLSGCVLPEDRPKMKSIFDVIFQIKEVDKLGEMISKRVNEYEDIIPGSAYFKIPPKYSSSFQAFLPIQAGCNKFCTYCAVPYTRGPEAYHPASQIMEEVEDLARRGFKEITLLGQTVNSYKNTEEPDAHIQTFADLLRFVAEAAPRTWIRFISPYPTDFTEELVEVIATHDNICKTIHMPVQSGNNEVLRRMARKYTREQYLEKVRMIRAALPDTSLTTDCIVGFCGETEEQFQDSLALFDEVKFDMAFTAQYSPRPGTTSGRFFKDDVPREVKKDREERLTKVLAKHSAAFNARLVGKNLPVLIEKEKVGFYHGRTEHNKPVRVPAISDGEQRVGAFADVRITSSTTWNLTGELMQ
ncbi:MAG: tRNA (N6-isopentenyl adenosine(37)-C2)-methylthiotransferase MiaB [Candidatus Kerfeldbacteria bacterium]|nr:tRNA (N6-isopentenyl adenosine(37)-C2)-methylthiotransferase MiaB [Candidatus Kerfeldbacteria bacterium]